ncbi:MAG: anthranilate phosphoribosyltransferase [Candidatus Omnitrophota bacterium]
METIYEKKEAAIIRAIKTAGVGKKGSRPLEPELINELLDDLRENRVHPISKAAFFGALFIKGLTPEEKNLALAFAKAETLLDPALLASELAPDAPSFVQEICSLLLKGETLNKESAYRLGKFLFSDAPGDGARGLVASILRVRYETPDEYHGLWGAMQDALEKPSTENIPAGKPVVQLAEPFDGVDNSYLITPLLADFIQSLNYRVVSLVGRNSGPKFGNNLLDLAKSLQAKFLLDNQKFTDVRQDFGWYAHQADLSSAIDRWVEIRRLTIKRPFLSTLEKFLNPVKAQILITSAFHPPYAEKMITIAERAGFPAVIVMRNGLEGTLSFPLNRPVKILCSVQKCEGEYFRKEFEINPPEILGHEIKIDEKLQNPPLEENARLIRDFHQNGKTDNTLFNDRIKVSCLGLKTALDWIDQNKF